MNIITDKLQGTWDYQNLVGAPVSIKSYRPEHSQVCFEDLTDQHTIEDIKFRVSCDGKIIPIFKLSDIDTTYFTAENLIIEGIKFDYE